MNRCVRDIFGYCTGNPKLTSHEEPQTFIDYGGHKYTQTIEVVKCTHDPLTCKWYITSTQAVLQFAVAHPHLLPEAMHHMLAEP